MFPEDQVDNVLFSEENLSSICIMYYLIILLMCLSGCTNWMYQTPVQQGRPYDEKASHELKTGMDMPKVLSLMGEPDYRNFFHKNQWYYLEEHPISRTHHDVNGLRLIFDQGRLAKVEPFTSTN